MDYARISINDKNLTITQIEDIGGRGSSPSVSQSAVEKQVKDIHDKCKKCSTYVGVAYDLEPIDYYDEGYDHYEVAGARMLKGDRKPRNESWEKTSTPKGWEERIRIQHKATTRTTKPLTDAFNVLGISTSYIKEVQKLLKKNGEAYISPKMITRGYYSEPSRTQFEVSDENNYY
jgi:transcription elongation factor Elf1